MPFISPPVAQVIGVLFVAYITVVHVSSIIDKWLFKIVPIGNLIPMRRVSRRRRQSRANTTPLYI